ncbi:Autophagy-related protein 14 [Nakaseomyces glabratus]|nr:Autophagy-related protein 14 [Nakaseomyces glabratus]KTB16250.1 Autophagy-related protein 14 [Nakaseomyces glabratus]
MGMQCPICETQSHVFYCAHCINSSPDLLIRLKFDLYILGKINNALRNKVDQYLEEVDDELNTNIRNGEQLESNIGVQILKERLGKVQVLRKERQNNKIKHKISQQDRRIKEKSRYIAELRSLINGPPKNQNKFTDPQTILKAQKQLQDNLEIAKRLSIQTRSEKLAMLNKWYSIRKRDSHDIPFTISYQPVISLKNFNRLPLPLIEGSLRKLIQYMNLLEHIYCIKYPSAMFVHEDEMLSLQGHGAKLKRNAPELLQVLIKLIQMILVVMTRSKLIDERKQNIDYAWILDQYDIDGLFYHMAMSIPIDTKSGAKNIQWSTDRLVDIVCSSLGAEKEEVLLKDQKKVEPPTDKEYEVSDRWYIVG